MEKFSWRDNLYARFINLDHRVDRYVHMMDELERVNLDGFIERMKGINWKDHTWDPEKYGVMLRRTPGAIGCHQSQVRLMESAYSADKSAWVNEDDLVFCSDIIKRLDYIENFVNNQPEWDVIFLGGTVHVGPPWWHKSGHSSDLAMCSCNLSRDAERTIDPRMLRTYGAFSTHSYIVNRTSIPKILQYFDDNVHLSMGIDWLFIKMQPELKAFMFVPGCVKQIDNASDIGVYTKFSGFSRLNGTQENSRYWWQDRMEDFDPDKFNWHEANIL